jgi:hypothetical protein
MLVISCVLQPIGTPNHHEHQEDFPIENAQYRCDSIARRLDLQRHLSIHTK